MSARIFRALLAAAILVLVSTARADPAMLDLLRKGGQVLFIRHATTVPGVGDPSQFRLDDCATQRNLSDEGRAEARRLGKWLGEERVRIERVVSSPWCRCLDTARLAFGRVDDTWKPLSNLFGRPEAAAAQVQALRPRIAQWAGKGNLVLVSHGSVASALADVHPAQGEIIVLTPIKGEGFKVAGRLSPPPR